MNLQDVRDELLSLSKNINEMSQMLEGVRAQQDRMLKLITQQLERHQEEHAGFETPDTAPQPAATDDDAILGTLALRGWQSEAVAAWRANDFIGVVEAVTGTGKTRVGIAAIALALQRGMRCIVMVPSRALVAQWAAQIKSLLPYARVTHNWLDNGDVLVTTVHAILKRPHTHQKTLLVADECHRYGSERWSTALREEFTWRLGLSATFERGDEADNRVLAPYFNRVIYSLGFGEARRRSLIAPFRVAMVGVPLTAQEHEDYEQYSQALRNSADALKKRFGLRVSDDESLLTKVQEIAQDPKNQGYKTARYYLSNFAKRRQLLAEAKSKFQLLLALESALRESQGCLIFTQTKEAAESAANIMNTLQISAAAVHSDHSSQERDDLVGRFETGSTRALAAPRILDEGVDLPAADLGIVLAANRSRRQMIQRLGRIVRKKMDGRVAKFVLVFASGTVEDPCTGRAESVHFDEILSNADRWEKFDLLRDGPGNILSFLGEGATLFNENYPTFAEVISLNRPESSPRLITEETPAGDHWSLHAQTKNGDAKLWHHETKPASSGAGDPVYEEPQGEIDDVGDEFLVELISKQPKGHSLERSQCAKLQRQQSSREYKRQIGQHRLLSKDEARDLSAQIEAGLTIAKNFVSAEKLDDEPARALRDCSMESYNAYCKMVVANLRLVFKVASSYRDSRLELMDLVQEGNIGLMRAVYKFDYRRDCRFSTYATWWIRSSIERAIANSSRTIRVPAHIHEKISPLRRTYMTELRQSGVPLSAAEIASCHNKNLIEVEQLLSFDADPASLETVDANDNRIANWSCDVLRQSLRSQAQKQAIRDLFADLSSRDPRALDIVKRRHAFTGGIETLEEIGQSYGLTRERVRQIESKALKHLKWLVGLEDQSPYIAAKVNVRLRPWAPLGRQIQDVL